MTVRDFNNWYTSKFNKAASFVNCLNHALQKTDDNAKAQLKAIGWDKETDEVLIEALRILKNYKRECIDCVYSD